MQVITFEVAATPQCKPASQTVARCTYRYRPTFGLQGGATNLVNVKLDFTQVTDDFTFVGGQPKSAQMDKRMAELLAALDRGASGRSSGSGGSDWLKESEDRRENLNRLQDNLRDVREGRYDVSGAFGSH
jgi:hypothetical protein